MPFIQLDPEIIHLILNSEFTDAIIKSATTYKIII